MTTVLCCVTAVVVVRVGTVPLVCEPGQLTQEDAPPGSQRFETVGFGEARVGVCENRPPQGHNPTVSVCTLRVIEPARVSLVPFAVGL